VCADFAQKEKSRYERKGYGLIVAVCIALGFFIGVPYLGKLYWPYLLQWQDDYNLSYTWVLLTVAISLHNLVHLGGNLVYCVFYTYEFSFIERYKSNDLPWPWLEDPEGWRVLSRKSILVLLFNSNVLPPLVYLLLDHFEALEPHSMA